MTWMNVIISVVSVVLTALAGWGVAKLTAFIDSKISDTTLKNLLNGAVEVVTSVVKEVYQTYVENIKGTDAWTAEAQKEALQKALEKTKQLLSESAIEYIETYFGSLEIWLTTQIESTIYTLKNSASEGGE